MNGSSAQPNAEVSRAWDEKNGHFTAKILPGEYYVTAEDEMVTTVLGSCISACIRDVKFGFGGMNHFMLPSEGSGGSTAWSGMATRYGNYAMEHLINDILKLGGKRERLEVKLFGGGKMVTGMADIGSRNADFAKEYLATEGLAIVSEDVGLTFPRRVNYYPRTGRVMVRRLRALHRNVIVQSEQSYEDNLKSTKIEGEIELF